MYTRALNFVIPDRQSYHHSEDNNIILSVEFIKSRKEYIRIYRVM